MKGGNRTVGRENLRAVTDVRAQAPARTPRRVAGTGEPWRPTALMRRKAALAPSPGHRPGPPWRPTSRRRTVLARDHLVQGRTHNDQTSSSSSAGGRRGPARGTAPPTSSGKPPLAPRAASSAHPGGGADRSPVASAFDAERSAPFSPQITMRSISSERDRVRRPVVQLRRLRRGMPELPDRLLGSRDPDLDPAGLDRHGEPGEARLERFDRHGDPDPGDPRLAELRDHARPPFRLDPERRPPPASSSVAAGGRPAAVRGTSRRSVLGAYWIPRRPRRCGRAAEGSPVGRVQPFPGRCR